MGSKLLITDDNEENSDGYNVTIYVDQAAKSGKFHVMWTEILIFNCKTKIRTAKLPSIDFNIDEFYADLRKWKELFHIYNITP